MKISKVRDVKTPVRGTEKSAGLDFFIPNDFHMFTILAPGESINIPSGIIADIPENCALIAFNKSGQATKKNLQVGACVCDEDYQGEIHLHVRNIGTSNVTLNAGEKLTQFIVLPIKYEDIEVVPIEELFETETERGSGAFGHTGTN